jgi:hypothetical protein|tara:strand:- start:3478 stop:3693 length:216 start_codon:yes stop_codon:yes gene_type:complete
MEEESKPVLTVNDVEYPVEELSDEARFGYSLLTGIIPEINELTKRLAVLNAARNNISQNIERSIKGDEGES